MSGSGNPGGTPGGTALPPVTPTPVRPGERKIRPPPDFSGDRTQASLFFNTCRTYLRLNDAAYPSDEEKIIFILSFMEGGTAGPWKEVVMQDAYETDARGVEKGFGTFADFRTNFFGAFQPLSPAMDCITRMKNLKQTGSAEDYVAQFRVLAAKSTVTDIDVLSDYFLTGLMPGLVKNIMTCEKLPSTIDGYFDLASRLDLQWRKANEYTKQTKAAQPQPSRTSSSSSSTQPTRLRKLTDEERAHFKSKGICFRCRVEGHIARDCKGTPFSPSSTPPPSSSLPRKIRIISSKPADIAAPPKQPIERIRAIYAGLTDAEKEEVVNIAEAEGF